MEPIDLYNDAARRIEKEYAPIDFKVAPHFQKLLYGLCSRFVEEGNHERGTYEWTLQNLTLAFVSKANAMLGEAERRLFFSGGGPVRFDFEGVEVYLDENAEWFGRTGGPSDSRDYIRRKRSGGK